MRRQGQYTDSGVDAYVAAQTHHAQGQRMDNNSAQFEGRLEAFTPERERDTPYGSSKADGQWRWGERDGSKMSNSLKPQMFNDGQSDDGARSYFQGQIPDTKMIVEKQSNSDTRSQPRNKDVDAGYGDNPQLQTFQGLDQKLNDDIVKLAKEQTDAEDAENARHREKINAINAQYEEQLAALRARHANCRDEFLRRESSMRQQQYQQVVVDRYAKSSVTPNDPHSYSGFAASAAKATTAEANRSYNNEQYDSYRERARFLGGSRDHEFEPRGPYHGGRVYDTGSSYY